MRWKHWQELAAVRTVPRSHARYAAYMAFRCYLLDQGGGLRRADNNQIADIATIIILSVRRDDEGFFWFGDLLLDHELGEDLYKPIYDESDKGMASALMSLAALLNSEIGSRDDILPNDHDVIKGAF